jgi:DNA mismatch endonuclease (patch repair protein)
VLKFETTKQRSRNMREIKASSNATTELRLRALLMRSHTQGWRVRPSEVPGVPDFLFEDERIAVFVDGCFWHGCPRCGHIPLTNRRYWVAKLARNKRRDRAISKTLKSLGYRVTRIWECQLRAAPKRCLARLKNELKRRRKNLVPTSRLPTSIGT